MHVGVIWAAPNSDGCVEALNSGEAGRFLTHVTLNAEHQMSLRQACASWPGPEIEDIINSQEIEGPGGGQGFTEGFQRALLFGGILYGEQ